MGRGITDMGRVAALPREQAAPLWAISDRRHPFPITQGS